MGPLATGPIRILIVDDEEDLRASLERHFRRAGFEVAGAGGGYAAIELCRQQDFDVVLTDIQMPKGSGVELLDALRGFGPRAPVVVCMSAFSDLTAEAAKVRGAAALFPKPLDLKAIIEAIRHFHRDRQQRRAAGA